MIKWISIISIGLATSCGNPFGSDTEVNEEFGGNSGPGEPTRVSIETANDGTGSEVNNLSVSDGTPTTLYAVSRDADGEFVETATVSWSLTNNLGTLSTSSGSSTIFTPTTEAGTETVTASHASLTNDTGTLAVSYTVTDISGLRLWLKATGTVTYNGSNEVSSWTDHSGNSNDFSQSSPSLKPLFVTSGVGGIASVRFDGK